MLSSPTHAVVGCSRLEAAAAFLSPFGFEVEARGTLDAGAARALYGLEYAAAEWKAAVPGVARGFPRLVETGSRPRAVAIFDPRPFAIDLFTRDIEKSLEVGRAAGGLARGSQTTSSARSPCARRKCTARTAS